MSFFDFDKVQKDFLAAALKAQKKNAWCDWFMGHDDEKKNTFISDGHFIAILPDVMCYIKTGEKTRTIDAKTFLQNMPKEYDIKPVIDTGMRKDITSPCKVTVCILKAEDGDEIWINKKYLDYFSGMNYRLAGTTAKAPVMVYALDVPVGLILPINHK